MPSSHNNLIIKSFGKTSNSRYLIIQILGYALIYPKLIAKGVIFVQPVFGSYPQQAQFIKINFVP